MPSWPVRRASRCAFGATRLVAAAESIVEVVSIVVIGWIGGVAVVVVVAVAAVLAKVPSKQAFGDQRRSLEMAVYRQKRRALAAHRVSSPGASRRIGMDAQWDAPCPRKATRKAPAMRIGGVALVRPGASGLAASLWACSACSPWRPTNGAVQINWGLRAEWRRAQAPATSTRRESLERASESSRAP